MDQGKWMKMRRETVPRDALDYVMWFMGELEDERERWD